MDVGLSIVRQLDAAGTGIPPEVLCMKCSITQNTCINTEQGSNGDHLALTQLYENNTWTGATECPAKAKHDAAGNGSRMELFLVKWQALGEM